MNGIFCQLCQELIPLVKDDVANEERRSTVLQHIAGCVDCQEVFSGFGTEKPTLDEKRVVKKLKQQPSLVALVLLTAGVLFGLGVGDSSLIFYSILVMPGIGAVSYFVLKEKSYWTPIGMVLFTAVWNALKYLLRGELAQRGMLLIPLFWGLIYAGLSALGVIVAFLLQFAFTKEVAKDANHS